jgi:hypothetical protein
MGLADPFVWAYYSVACAWLFICSVELAVPLNLKPSGYGSMDWECPWCRDLDWISFTKRREYWAKI